MPEKYYSQYGQDKYLDTVIFKGLRGGFFLEIGANDGITYSNTYFFETYRAWNGICVEPHPSAFSKLKANRKCRSINSGVSNKEGDLEFVKIEGYAEMLSGLKDKYDKEHLLRIESEIKVHGGSKETILVPCRRLDTILKENEVEKIDYCSIDIEGGELEILDSIDLRNDIIRVISIENNYYGKKIKNYLQKFNYKQFTTIKCDEIYVKKKSIFSFF